MTSEPLGPALITPTRAVDRKALAAAADRVEAGVAAALAPGTPLGIWVEDTIDFAACAIAAMAAGAEGFILAPGATVAGARELCRFEGAAAVLCDQERASRLGAGVRRECSSGLVLVEVTAESDPPVVSQQQGALHFYTSGTDGKPKGVVRTRQSLHLEESTVGGQLGMAPGCTVLCAVPIIHGYGYTAGVFAPMSFGGRSVVAQPRLAASLARLLTEYRPDVVVAVPAQYAAWATLREPYTGPMPRVWLCGGAPLPPALRSRFQAAWGCVIAEQYGATECGAITVDLEGAQTLGRPYPGATVCIEGGDPTGPGEVLARTPYGPRGYIGDPAGDSATRFTAEGFRTGDTGWFDDQGRFHLVGRRAHQLNVRGEKVDPAEIERALWSVDGVTDVAVVGMDRAEGDQWIAAFVGGAEPVSEAVLHQATEHLEPFKRPQRLTCLPELPKTSSGKTDLDALRSLARSGAATPSVP
jgi:acyl-coenzyme A synthetase/AMP-(fatty) acid ligase